MKLKIFILAMVLIISSCVVRGIFATNVSIGGKVVEVKICNNCRYGNRMYVVQSKNGETVRLITNDKYQVGDNISIVTKIENVYVY